MISKQDARGTTSYTYDELNRVLTKSYSDTSTVRACYAYDGYSSPFGDSTPGPPAVGHLTGSWSVNHDRTVVAAEEWYNFDAMGRPWAGKQCTPGTCGLTSYPLAMAYNDLGNETGFSDPAQTRSTGYDSTDRLLSFATTLPSLGNVNMLTNPVYNALGLTQVSLGNGLTETRAYNLQRTWLNSVQVGSVYSFSIPTFDGNGNVLTANDNTNGNWTYQYDSVNRLKTATIGGQNFNYSYTADGSNGQFGNMTCTAPSGTTYSCTPLGLGFNQSNNQITTSGYKYDAAGNLLSDNTHGYVYDAENRIACVGVDINGNCTTNSTYYFYDPQGQRVGKQQYDTLEDYVYDPQGHITSVYANGSASPFRAELYTPQGRHVATWNPSTNYRPLFFNNADWLGTERARTDSGGTVRQSCADTPYGMNLTCTPPDLSPMHFTGKQRDYESNLDYFGARYFGGGSSLGRFMSPDEVFADQHPSSPQSWNLYSYTRNNPLTFVDDDGLRVIEAALKYTYYDVHGATAAEARANALAISGIKEEGEPMMGKTSGPMKVIDIRTQWSVQGYEGTYVTAQETLTSADVDLEQTITLPTWANESQASPEEKAAWDNAMTQLDDHEKGHAAINRDQSHKLDASLPGTSGSGGAPKSTDAFKEANAKLSQKLNQKVSANAAETNTRQVNYDKNTGHGTKKPDQ